MRQKVERRVQSTEKWITKETGYQRVRQSDIRKTNMVLNQIRIKIQTEW